MIYLALDTNIWIYLLDEAWKGDNSLEYLEHWIAENQIRIVLPEIVQKEWNKHKEGQKQERVKKLNDFLAMAKEIFPNEFLQDQLTPEHLNHIVSEYSDRIERIISQNSEILPIEETIKLKAIEWGLERKAPMHKGSSLADTLIVLTLLEFAANHPQDKVYFLSENTADFCKNGNKNEIHDDLLPAFTETGLVWMRPISRLIYEMKKVLPVTVDIQAVKRGRLKRKFEQVIFNPAVSETLSHHSDSYLDNINTLDPILRLENPTKQQIMLALNLIDSGDNYAHYFYSTCKKHIWFDILLDRGVYLPENNPAPQQTNDGYNLPGWWALLYLITLSNDRVFIQDRENCKKVIHVIEDICAHPNENNRTWFFILKILTHIPNECIPENLFTNIPLWLSDKFDNSVISSLLCTDILKKFTPPTPTADDKGKAECIFFHLFSLTKATTPSENPEITSWSTLVYKNYLSEIPTDDEFFQQFSPKDPSTVVSHLITGLKTLLFDFPPGTRTVLADKQNKYQIKLGIDQSDVLLEIQEADAAETAYATRIENFLALDEESLNDRIRLFFSRSFAPSVPKERIEEALNIISRALMHGKANSMEFETINSLFHRNEQKNELIEIFCHTLTKVLFWQVQAQEDSKLVESLWNSERLPLIRRILLFLMTEKWNQLHDLFFQIAVDDPSVFSRYEYQKELFYLLQKTALNLSSEESNVLATIIENGPKFLPESTDHGSIEYWKLRWYAALKENGHFSEQYSTLSSNVNVTSEALEPASEVAVSIGATSPLSAEEILKVSNQEFSRFLLSFSPKDQWQEPNIEGLAQQFEKAAQIDPNHFIEGIHHYDNVQYVYIFYFLNGLRDACKDNTAFDWENLLAFCERYLNQEHRNTNHLRHPADPWKASKEWVEGAIAHLLSTGMKSQELGFDPVLQPQVKPILLKLVGDLQVLANQNYIATDFPTYSYNSTAGKVLRTLFDYSLSIARREQAMNQRPKWDQDMKLAFEEAMRKELIDGFILQGMYFEQFCYLDKDWIMQQADKNLNGEEKHWMAFMSGLLFGRAPWTVEVYHHLFPHYEKAITAANLFLTKNKQGFIRHIVSFYFWGYESIAENTIVFAFLNKASADLIREFIAFTSRQETFYASLAGGEKELFEQKIITLWNLLANRYSNAAQKEDIRTLSSLSTLLPLTGRLDAETSNLVLKSMSNTTEYYYWHSLIEDLLQFSTSAQADKIAPYIASVLEKLSMAPLHTEYEGKKINALVIYLFENGQQEKAFHICDQISRQGHQYLRTTYNKYRNAQG